MRASKRLPDGHPNKTKAINRHHEVRNTCRQVIREAKEKSWTEFVDGINDSQSATEIWNRFNSLQGKRRSKGIALKINNTLTRNPTIITDALADFFKDASSIQRYNETFLKHHPTAATAIADLNIPPDRGQDFNTPFSMEELVFALRKVKGKSAGVDDIGYPMLKNLPPCGKRHLLESINREWTNGTLP